MNSVNLIGRLTRDVEVNTTTGGTPVANFSLAVEENVKKGDTWTKVTHFIDCVVWGKRGEAFAKYHSKGSLAAIQGHLHMDEWMDRETNKKRTRLKVVGDEWAFVGAKPETTATHDRAPSHPAADDTPF
jgi:single-strand DNA-binding protein